jgi:hypothetical protein
MPRVMVLSDDGEMIWNEGVKSCDFEAEHFRHCLVDRLSWATADAESAWRLSTIRPIRLDTTAQRMRRPAAAPEPVGVAV